MAYHSSNGGVFCVRCRKPMSQWRAGDECQGDSRGHVGPSSPPSNFADEGYWYKCDNCDHTEESIDDTMHHKFCPNCEIGILHLWSPPIDIGSMGI